uniref:Ribosomal protein S2 n=1 Tax=Vischeria stellata TaxID=1104407 RepID=A0A481XEZ8_9STRA|nr:ribosomal protein S2 [Vischeria stellata]QBK36852.1 ribosomal protein S2 [Vischeria stellata]
MLVDYKKYIFCKIFFKYNLLYGGYKVHTTGKFLIKYLDNSNRHSILNVETSYKCFKLSLQFLKKILTEKKKILFLGVPKGLQLFFKLLCKKYKHYMLDVKPEGFFANYKSYSKSSFYHFKEKPSLIVHLSLAKNYIYSQEILRLNIPLMAFVNGESFSSVLSFPLPANINSLTGGLFAYNFFVFMFELSQDNFKVFEKVIKIQNKKLIKKFSILKVKHKPIVL